jgi:hypothetical protein
MARDLFIDMTNRRLATSLTNFTPSAPPRFVKGDNGPINLYFLEATGNISTPFSVVDMTGSSVKFGVGTRTGVPTSGTFTLSFGGETSGAIGYSATAGAISSALNSLSAITSIGKVSVDGSMGSNFIISFNSAGTRSAITADVSHLIPTASALIDERLAGDATTAEIQELQLRLAPAAYQPTWTDVGTAVTTTIQTTITGSDYTNAIQKLSFSRTPAQGSFSITVPTYSVSINSILTSGIIFSTQKHGFAINQIVTLTGFSSISGYTQGIQYFVKQTPSITAFSLGSNIYNSGIISNGSATTSGSSIATTILRQTAPIAAGCSAADISNALVALESIGSNNVSVASINDFFNITFIGEKSAFNMPTLQSASSLVANPAKTASVNFNTFGVRDYLENSTSVQADIEIELTTGGERNTIILQPCTLAEELISQGGIS